MRRSYAVSLVLIAVAAAFVLFAASREWVVVTTDRQPPLPPSTRAASGGSIVPGIPAVGFVLLTAILMIVVTKSWGRTVVGILTGLAGLLVVVLSWPYLGGAPGPIRDQVGQTGTTAPAGVSAASWAPWLVLVAGLLALAGAGLVLRYGSAWRGMSSRYERPLAPSPEQAAADRERSDRADWNSMDRGVDPTG